MTDPTTPGGANGNGGYDPWAAPGSRQPDGPAGTPGPPPPSVHDQPTMASMPSPGGFPPPPAPSPYDTGGHSPYDTAGHAPYDPTGTGAIPPAPAAPGGYGYPGYPQNYGGWGGAPVAPQNGMGVAAMVLGILACALFCLYGVVSIALGVLAIVFGIKGKKRAEQGVANNRGQAQAGLITGIIGLILGVAMIILMIIGFTAAFNEIDEDPSYDDPYYGAHSAPLDPAAQAR
ncbi:DUF4190 domain-containing protein [Streptomyces sp. NPDC004610]|uniref:DUF4190 domain-containing protein n=1 Tax=unclassified Streptomyces TaxID=2593676 RepID=UPI0033B9E7FC